MTTTQKQKGRDSSQSATPTTQADSSATVAIKPYLMRVIVAMAATASRLLGGL